jgi:hypothetical protein
MLAGVATSKQHCLKDAGFVHDLLEESLGHQIGTDSFDRRQAIVQAWADFCGGRPVGRRVSARHQGASHDESPRRSNSMTGLNWERATTVTGWLLTVEIDLRTNHEHYITNPQMQAEAWPPGRAWVGY